MAIADQAGTEIALDLIRRRVRELQQDSPAAAPALASPPQEVAQWLGATRPPRPLPAPHFRPSPADVTQRTSLALPPHAVTLPPAHPVPNDLGQLAIARLVGGDGLERARRIQRRTGGALLSVLTGSEQVNPAALADAVAVDTGLARFPLGNTSFDPEIVGLIDQPTQVKHRFVPFGRGRGGIRVAIADPFDESARVVIRERLAEPVELLIATDAEITAVLGLAWGEDNAREATTGFRDRHPDLCASVVITRAQKLAGLIALVVIAAAAAWRPIETFVGLNLLATVIYLYTSWFRLYVIALAAERPQGPERAELDASLLADDELPVYTILVPMYREAAVVPRVARALGRLDYPAHKLDVLMICEEDDEETIAAVEALGLGSQFRLIVVPDAQPKTKPKACNYALHHARGEMVVIFDAEDAPEPDQLRRVLMALGSGPGDIGCVQAKLEYGNAQQNLLTRWFAAEYLMCFDLMLPGLERFDAPIPLGGTSNHFRTTVLRELGGWDPFNVTEDADLGVRLYKRGFKTVIVDSKTMEEANSQVPNWIRQRSRWMKGHMQTWLVHTRHPIRSRRELGWRGFVGFQLTIGGSCFAALVNPFYWALMLVWLATSAHVVREIFPSFVYYVGSINLLVWNFAFVYAAAAGLARRGRWELLHAALLSPLYWVLISMAAWKGALQLITKPFYWEKTIHGLDGGGEP